MPKAAKPKKPTAPVAPTPPPPPQQAATPPPPPPSNLRVMYDRIEIDEYSTMSAKGPLDVEWAKGAMGWETEKQYQVRKVAEEHAKGNTAAKPEHYLFGENGPQLTNGGFQPIHCKNLAGEKVVCWNNAHNRAFDSDWCEALVHTILYGQWAGPHTIPVGYDGLPATVNGETVRISRYARVISGQHEMTAVILAGEWLAKAREQGTDRPRGAKYPAWKDHDQPFIEVIVVKGLTEDARVLMTVDYVKPRSTADVFYTSETFKDSTSTERKELCRMLASAVDTLWTRTNARGYRTHPEVVGFLDRHKKLLDCVLHLYAENGARAGKNNARRIAVLRLQPGACAALMFVQGSSGSKTDGDVYRNEEPPSQKHLDWSYWDRAGDFWALLATGPDFQPVRTALGCLVESTPGSDENQGLGGRGPEKLAILAKAWEVWKDHPASAGPPFDANDLAPGGTLCLAYSNLDDKGKPLPNGEIKLLDMADFYGIDCPASVGKGKASKGPPDPPPPTPEEMKKMYEAADERRRAAAKK